MYSHCDDIFAILFLQACYKSVSIWAVGTHLPCEVLKQDGSLALNLFQFLESVSSQAVNVTAARAKVINNLLIFIFCKFGLEGEVIRYVQTLACGHVAAYTAGAVVAGTGATIAKH